MGRRWGWLVAVLLVVALQLWLVSIVGETMRLTETPPEQGEEAGPISIPGVEQCEAGTPTGAICSRQLMTTTQGFAGRSASVTLNRVTVGTMNGPIRYAVIVTGDVLDGYQSSHTTRAEAEDRYRTLVRSVGLLLRE